MLNGNSFATVEYADHYFSMQINGDEWLTYDLELKEKSLNSSYSQISAFCEWEFEEPTESMKIAQCELAYNLAKEQQLGIVAEEEQTLKKLKTGPVEFQFYNESAAKSENGEIITDYIKKLLSKDCACTFASDIYQGAVEF